jgi:hypothetical protein
MEMKNMLKSLLKFESEKMRGSVFQFQILYCCQTVFHSVIKTFLTFHNVML